MAKYLDETGLAHFWDAVKALANRADGKTAKPDLNYVGRVDRTAYDQTHPQGFCMIDDSKGWFILTPTASEQTNTCTCLLINVSTGEILTTVQRDFAHCNGMCYNTSTDKVYVTPNYDYTNASAAINAVYICDSSTLAIEQTVTLSFSPHSIAYDKSTHKMWITEESSQTQYHINLYSFDAATNTATFVKDVYAFNLASNESVFAKLTSGYPYGYQNLAAYNDTLYYLVGGGINAIIMLDTSGEFLSVMNLNPKTFIYTYTEAEHIDFSDNGVMFVWGLGKIITRDTFAVISTVNCFGNTASGYDTVHNSARENVQSVVDGSKDANYNIYQLGYTNAPFATFREALAYAVESKYPVYILNTVEFVSSLTDFPASFGTIAIVGASGARLVMPRRYYFQCDLVLLGASSSNKLTVQIGKQGTTLSNSAFQFYKNMSMRYCTLDCAYTTSYPINSYGIFRSVTVSAENTDNVPNDGTNPYIINANTVGISSTAYTVRNPGTWVTA